MARGLSKRRAPRVLRAPGEGSGATEPAAWEGTPGAAPAFYTLRKAACTTCKTAASGRDPRGFYTLRKRSRHAARTERAWLAIDDDSTTLTVMKVARSRGTRRALARAR